MRGVLCRIPVVWVVAAGVVAVPPAANARDAADLVRAWKNAGRVERRELAPRLIEERRALAPYLRAALRAGGRDEKLFACALLPELRDLDAVPALIEATRDADLAVRRRAVSALRRLGDGRAAARLREIVGNAGDRALLKRAMAGLGRVGATQDAALIAPHLQDANEDVRVIAAAALAMLGDSRGAGALIAATRSDDPRARKNATFALGYLSDPASLARLHEIAADPAGQWRSYAAMALARRETVFLPLPDRVARLAEFGRARDRLLATWALDELTEIGAPHAIPALRELAQARVRVRTLAGYRLGILEGAP